MAIIWLMTVIVTGGASPERIPSTKDARVIAADSGYDTAIRLGLSVDEVVGDLDSTMYRSELVGHGVVPCSHDKDETDTELAMMRLSEGEPYILIGGGGGRLAHLVSLFASFRKYHLPLVWLTDCEAIISFSGSLELAIPPSSRISLFSLDGASVTCPSLVWPLEDYHLDTGSVSLSNRTVGERTRLEAEGQAFAVIDIDVFLDCLWPATILECYHA